jgi:hypothetical protein
MKIYFNSTFKSLRQVFTKPVYIIVAILTAILILFIANILPNYQFVWFVLLSSAFSLLAKFKIILGLFSFFLNNSTVSSQILLVLTSIFALAVFYFKRKISTDRLAGVGIFGVVGSFFGIGCSACGSVVLSSLLGIGASGQLIKLLPLRGAEFSILSILILLASSIYISKKIQDPLACKI